MTRASKCVHGVRRRRGEVSRWDLAEVRTEMVLVKRGQGRPEQKDSCGEDKNQEDVERNEMWERMTLSFVGTSTIDEEPRVRFGQRKHRGKRRKTSPGDGETTQQSVAKTTSKKR